VIAWSCGGGVQSVAIGVLIREGVLPKPDLAGIADTGRERRATWTYLREHLQLYLDPVGVKIEVVPHSLARVDLYDRSTGLTLIPAYTAEGRLAAFCSGEWKRDVMERWLRSKGVTECVQWLGFSLDEIRRATGKAHRPWCKPAYPLIDLLMTRQGCYRIIEGAGLPRPPKSRCWMCPHQNAEEWREVAADPGEWAKAVALDEEIRAADPEGRGDLYLHSSRVPLSLADLSEKKTDDDFPLFRACQDAGCWT
jgi:hypothetical protein